MIWRRLWFLLRRRKLERELAEEMAAHRAMMASPADFGNSARIGEEAAEAWGFRWLDELAQDARHGWRVFRRSPSFSLTAVAVLALGFGVNLALYQVTGAAVMRPPRLREPETLVRLFQNSRSASSSGVAYPVAEYVRQNNTVFSAMIVTETARMNWGDGAEDPIPVAFVSGNYFSEFGPRAAAGRLLGPGETELAAVVSHGFWRSRLGGDPRAIGSRLRLNGRNVAVAGVAEEGFSGPRLEPVSVWLPMERMSMLYPGTDAMTQWSSRRYNVYGRLAPGVTETAAREALRAPMAELGRLYPKEMGEEPWLGTAPGTNHFRDARSGREVTVIFSLLAGVCGLVLVIACSNLASLTMAHTHSRSAEFRMRAALGAGRGRIVRQLVTEAGLLALAGLVPGWWCGYALARVIAAWTGAPFSIPVIPDWTAALAAAALVTVAVLFTGVVPALRAGTRRTRTRAQRVLAGVQVLGSCVLLLLGSLMARKLDQVASADPGFAFADVAVLEASLDRYGLSPAAAGAYWAAVRDTVAADARVRGTALTTTAPLGRTLHESEYRVDAPGLKVTVMNVDGPFFDLLRIPLLAGRSFGPGDTPENAVIVSRRLAERMYGSMEAVGKSFPKSGDGPRAVIVGVASDSRLIKVTATNLAECYFPMTQRSLPDAQLLARVRGGQLEALRAAARKVNPAIEPAAHWMKTDFEKKLEAPRLTSLGAWLLGALALALTGAGIFGLVAFTVSLRTREIGIRVALGARPGGVLWLVVRDLALPVGAGAAGGLAIVTGGMAKVLSGEPFYVDAGDPATAAMVLGVLLIAAAGAALGPSARALRIQPSSALRE